MTVTWHLPDGEVAHGGYSGYSGYGPHLPDGEVAEQDLARE